MPGMVRMSLGCYNTAADVERLAEMLERIARADYLGDYQLDSGSGEYVPAGYEDPLAEYLPFVRAWDASA
jgi:hypothetical protein